MNLDKRNPVAVLIHGCHLQADLGGRDWRNLVWGSEGDEPTMAGRVPMGVYVALFRGARLVTFSTGASEKDGLKEAEYTYRFLMDRLEPLAELLSRKLNEPLSAAELGKWIRERHQLDVTSQNTVEETASNLALALGRKCKEVIGVTNAFHAPRCLLGLQAARIKYDSPLLISVIPAYDEATGTVVIEVPHRGDQRKHRFASLAQRFFRVPPDEQPAFEEKVEGLLESHSA